MILSAIPLGYITAEKLKQCNFDYPSNTLSECSEYDPGYYRDDCNVCWILRQGMY